MGQQIERAPTVVRRRVMGWRLPDGIRASTLVVVLGFVLAACGSGAAPVSAPTTATSNPPTSTTEALSEVPTDVLAAYRAMWSDLVTAARTSDYRSPLLPQHATGDALTLFVQGLARDQLNDIITKGEPVLDPRIAALAPAAAPVRATVLDCFDNAHWVEYKTTGGLAKNAPGGRRKTTAELVEKDGTWKVTQITVGKTGTC